MDTMHQFMERISKMTGRPRIGKEEGDYYVQAAEEFNSILGRENYKRHINASKVNGLFEDGYLRAWKLSDRTIAKEMAQEYTGSANEAGLVNKLEAWVKKARENRRKFHKGRNPDSVLGGRRNPANEANKYGQKAYSKIKEDTVIDFRDYLNKFTKEGEYDADYEIAENYLKTLFIEHPGRSDEYIATRIAKELARDLTKEEFKKMVDMKYLEGVVKKARAFQERALEKKKQSKGLIKWHGY